MSVQRRLAAILVADVVGYSKLVGADEMGTIASVTALRRDVLAPAIGRHAGRLFKAVGDGFLAEFASAVQAVTAARAIQQANEAGPLSLRIGIHIGDVIVQGDDLMGDGVNIAARIEGIAEAGGIAISQQVHDQVRGKVGLSFVDKSEIALRNIEHPVHVFAVSGASASPPRSALALPDKPSIAVLPFQNMSGDPEQEYFADGMVEDIITALSRTKALFVIARNSSFSYKGKSPDIRQVGRELGVRYVLEGSVRKAASRVRITAQLIDSQSGAHTWADRFDSELEDIFALQDEVASRVVVAIVPSIAQADIERSSSKTTESLAAYDCSLRGWSLIDQPTRQNNRKAQEYFERAIELDPKFALAWAQIAGCYVQRKSWRWIDDPKQDTVEVERLVRKALELDRSDPRVVMLCGFALGEVVGSNEESRALLERATELDPNYFFAWLQLGLACQRLGKPAMAYFERALRLNPRDVRAAVAVYAIGNEHMHAGDHAKAIEFATDTLRLMPAFPPALLLLVAAQVHAGHIDEARETLERLHQARPGARIANMVNPNMFKAYRQKFIDGLRLAGMAE